VDGDEQDIAEASDTDKIEDERVGGGINGRTGDDELAVTPSDAPMGAHEYGVTDRAAALDEPIAERIMREEPDPVIAELDADTDTNFDAEKAEDPALHADRRSAGFDADLGTASDDTNDMSAEEAALHVIHVDDL
jgi:hypothetical protein